MIRVIIPDDYERPILSIFDGFKIKCAAGSALSWY